MDVVGVAVVGRAQRDDCIEPRRAQRRHLQGVEAAPRDTHHADLSGAPELRNQPGDHVAGVVHFLLRVFVGHQPVRVAIAAHVHAHAGVAMAGQVRVGECVAHMGAVAFAVGQVFQDRRYRMLIRIHRHPHARGKFCAVGKGDEGVGDFAHFARKGLDGFHGGAWRERRGLGRLQPADADRGASFHHESSG